MKKTISIISTITLSTLCLSLAATEPIDSLLQEAEEMGYEVFKKAHEACEKAFDNAIAKTEPCIDAKEEPQDNAFKTKLKRSHYRESTLIMLGNKNLELEDQFYKIRKQEIYLLENLVLSSESASVINDMKNDWFKSVDQLAEEAAAIVLVKDIQDFTTVVGQKIYEKKLELKKFAFSEKDIPEIAIGEAFVKALEKRRESINPSIFEHTIGRTYQALKDKIAQSDLLNNAPARIRNKWHDLQIKEAAYNALNNWHKRMNNKNTLKLLLIHGEI